MKFNLARIAGAAPLLLTAALLCQPVLADSPSLTIAKTVVIPGGPGGFDWMLVDAASSRVFATHKGTKSLAIVDLKTDAALPSVTVGTAQGIAIDRKDGKIFLGDEEEHKVVVLDYGTLKKTGEIPVSGPVDDILYCAQNGKVYADHDDGEDVWVIDAKSAKLVGDVKIPSAPEKLEYDPTSGRIYQNIKSNSTIQVIDPATDQVAKTISTAPATGPHGLAIDVKSQRLFTGGSNGKLVVIDLRSGKSVAAVDIQRGVDQIAFDPGNQRVYCACQGAVSVVQETPAGAKLLGNVTTPRGCHTIAVDSQSHAVWTCYSDGKASYLVKLVQ